MSKYNNSKDPKIRGGIILFLILGFGVMALIFNNENYSNGERIGYVTKFSHKGQFWKSWEGELNLTQTGMNTSSTFDFSIDNDKNLSNVIATIDEAVNKGWKVKLTYHQVNFRNWFSNRGETDYFVDNIVVLDKNTPGSNSLLGGDDSRGHIIDTVYVVIDKSELQQQMQAKKVLNENK
jgi:hypothetical protein